MEERSHTPKGQAARQRILRAAESILAARGFHGTSMRDVAEASGISLANVVYHFAKKEKLHAAVLGEIATQLLSMMSSAAASEHTTEVEREVPAEVRALIRWSLAYPGRVRLLLRELLDNSSRVSRASAFPLAPVLTSLAAVVAKRGHPSPELAVLHIIGAVSYVVTAHPTVRRIVGTARDAAMMAAYEAEATAFASRVLTITPPSPSTPRKRKKKNHHATRAANQPREARPRARRSEDNRHGGSRRPTSRAKH